MSCAAPLGAKNPNSCPRAEPLVRASNPALWAPGWKQPALYSWTIEFRAVVHPGVLAKVTLPAARWASQLGSGPYTVEVAISRARIPVFGAAEPASPNSALPFAFAVAHACMTSENVDDAVSVTPEAFASASL